MSQWEEKDKLRARGGAQPGISWDLCSSPAAELLPSSRPDALGEPLVVLRALHRCQVVALGVNQRLNG